ncbi:putative thiamine transporter SLC35F3 [Hypsibius exemplaris]|uniref:Thiamine transporter SLC35F3 n=1 Tax=Hypsibius exemplaris TaxID=2072580 RepID=A0A1W0XCU6_HYPEX|nr:putative thiamine transporter SLC35F3 [Hypsibius exemplaris]
MDTVENGANAEETADHVPLTAPLLEESNASATVSVEMGNDDGERTDGTVSEESMESQDEPVDVVGGDGDFVVVPKSGLLVTSVSQAEKEREAAQEGDVESRLGVPTISKKLSIIGGGSLANVEFTRKASVLPPKKGGLQGLSDAKKHTLGICLIMVHCMAIVGSNQFAKQTYSNDFSAPFSLVYFRTVWRISIFPFFMVVKYFHRRYRHRGDGGPVSFMKTYRSCTAVFGPEGLTVKSFFYPCGMLAVLWVVVQTSNVFAIKFLNNSIVSALFCSETAFCYLLSAIVLKARVYFLKVSAVLIALVGVGLMAYSQLTGSDLRWEGIAISIVGSFLGSVYMVAVKKNLGKTEDVGQALLLTSAMSLFVTLTCWPAVLGLQYSGWEYWDLQTIPWMNVNISSGLMLVGIYVFTCCLVLTNPLLLTLSKLLGIPVNYCIDWMLYNQQFDIYQIFGVLLIGVGFVFIALPERWLVLKTLAKKLRLQASSVPPVPDKTRRSNSRSSNRA